MKQEFYIGYLPKMLEGFKKVVRTFVITAFVVSAALAIIIWNTQEPFAGSFFEFGTVKEFAGTIEAKPIPFLLIERSEKNDGLPLFERLPLVAEGKHGADIGSYDGQRVTLKGKLIYRDNLKMIEVSENSIAALGAAADSRPEAPEDLGEFTLRGEIVDSKCYLGVMNPGRSKPHRDCAVACLRGGIPPLFVVRDDSGTRSELWLLSPEGEPINKEILDFVAEPVAITGEIKRAGDQLFFYVRISSIDRLD